MFEWLEEKGIKFNEQWGYIKKYNPETKMFIVADEDNDEILGEVNIFKTGIAFNIDYFEDWQKKLMSGLLRNEGKITIDLLSTESADSHFLEIYRHKTLLPTHEFSDQIILTNYVIVCSNEIKGDIFTREHKNYAGCLNDEEKEFSEWIEEQIEKVSEFNNTNNWQCPCEMIVFSNCLCNKEEYDLLHEMFNEIYYSDLKDLDNVG